MNNIDFSNKLIHPSNVLVSGPTGCGKTNFVFRLIVNNMFNTRFDRIVIVYSEWQTLYDKLKLYRPDIEFVQNFDEKLYESFDPKANNIVILDDQMTNIGSSKTITNLFTKGSHHRNITIIYLVQNFYEQNKNQRTITLNSQYIVLFKNPRGHLQAMKFGMEMFPNRANVFSDIYKDATQEPHGYLLIDTRPETPDQFRLRTKIFPGEESYVYTQQ